MALAELVDLPPDRALMLMLDQNGGDGLGLIVLSPAVLSGLVEMLTTGRVTAAPPPNRRPTRTDGAMLAALVDAALTGLTWAMELPLFLVIFGGVRRIANVAQVVVPVMAVGYLLVAAVVMALNVDALPGMARLIVDSAFGTDAAFGAMIGTAIQWGVRRGVMSNEAGMGSGAHPAAAAELSHPVKQGLVQAFSVYIDTLVVCSATAFLVLSTGAYNVYDPAAASHAGMLVANVPGLAAGPHPGVGSVGRHRRHGRRRQLGNHRRAAGRNDGPQAVGVDHPAGP